MLSFGGKSRRSHRERLLVLPLVISKVLQSLISPSGLSFAYLRDSIRSVISQTKYGGKRTTFIYGKGTLGLWTTGLKTMRQLWTMNNKIIANVDKKALSVHNEHCSFSSLCIVLSRVLTSDKIESRPDLINI